MFCTLFANSQFTSDVFLDLEHSEELKDLQSNIVGT